MKRLLLLLVFSFSLLTSFAQGVPFIRNYMSEEYHAHNRNFDIEIGKDGTIFVANFEGLMYYDNAEWRMLHTPGITRVTVVYRDRHDVIWVGGYNYFGRIIQKPNGELALQRMASKGLFRGEVLEIWDNGSDLNFLVNDGNLFKVDGKQVKQVKRVSSEPLKAGLSDIVQTDAVDKNGQVVVLQDVTQEEELDAGLKAIVRKGRGISIIDDSGRELYSLTEENGLCCNSVTYVAYDGHGVLWGATDNGVFSVAVPSSYSRFTKYEGLTGEVEAIEEYNGEKYIGTNSGLFRLTGYRLQQVQGVNHACWKLAPTPQGLLAATANGIYRIAGSSVTQLTNANTLSLMVDGGLVYCGEIDAVYTMTTGGSNHQLVCKLEKVTNMAKDADGSLWLQNLYGEVWCKRPAEDSFKPHSVGVVDENAATLVMLGGKVTVVNAETTKPFPYPQFSYADANGVTWLTNNEGKGLYRWKDGKRLTDNIDAMLFPLSDFPVRSLFCKQQEIWIGMDKEIVIIDTSKKDYELTTKPKMLFRSVVLKGDSVLWGGYGQMPTQLQELDTEENDLRFTYAVNFEPLGGMTLYRYRLNNGNWSAWADDHDAEFFNLSPGSYTIETQALLAFGELSEVAKMEFKITPPFYVRWYMNLLYALLLAVLVYGLFRYRLHRLNQEKEKLETIVQERTADLRNAQHELIRQEKMATVGKLTQGLIDRILNPLNYINNFAKLSEGLVKDVEANVEDEEDHMDKENYEDTMDVLDMLRGNLQKVSEHGQNTTRTLKAMEEMLKDRSGGIVPMDLVPVLRQDEEMLQTYFASDIKTHAIKTSFDISDAELRINGNAEQLSKTFMSMLGNSIYAVVKKAQKTAYVPEVTLKAQADGDKVTIVIRDNGIGIEETIINKIYDPFFTTKTTGEAAGVGLYLSREIVQNHGGDIQVKSVKNEYSEFTIVLPALKA